MSLLSFQDESLDYILASTRLRGYCSTKVNNFRNSKLDILGNEVFTGGTRFPELEIAMDIDTKLSALSTDANAFIAVEELKEIIKDAKAIESHLTNDIERWWIHGIGKFYTKEELIVISKDLTILLKLVDEAIVNSTNWEAIQEARKRASTTHTAVDLNLFGYGYHNPFADASLDDKSSLEYLTNKYNKSRYVSKTASASNGTFLKLGPLIYGGEVQDIKILENKAISEISAIRSNTSFIADSGQSDADIQISLVFSGEEHIHAGFKPLIALFKIAPIMSVKNEMINKALENIFTENAAIIPKEKLMELVKKGEREHNVTKMQAALAESYNKSVKLANVNPLSYGEIEDLFQDPDKAEAAWNKIHTVGSYPAGTIYDSKTNSYVRKYPTFDNWKEEVIDRNLATGSAMTEPDGTPITTTTDPVVPIEPSHEGEDRIDNTGHVPVAFVNMAVSTHPELPESIVVDLFLKRINIRNYLQDFLQYRTINNTPTSDPTKAFWLIRAMDIYIDKYMKGTAIDFDKVELEFKGDKIELASFKNSHPEELKKLSLNKRGESFSPLSPTAVRLWIVGLADQAAIDSVVTQMSYSITNHFSFHKLLGEAYPTAQFMGSTASGLSMSIMTNDRIYNSTFEKIHTYASAADFFARHTDRFNRMQGWDINCFLTDFFSSENPSEKGTGVDTGTAKKDFNMFDPNRKLYYPKTISSLTVPDSPDLKTVHLSFAETSPDWFSNFGFTLKQGSYNIGDLYKVYKILLRNADQYVMNGLDPDDLVGGTLDYQANIVTWNIGGNADAKLNLINTDTLAAAMIESRIFEDKDGGKLAIEENKIGKDLYAVLQSESDWSGLKLPEDGVDSVFDVIGDIAGGIYSAWTGVTIPRKLAYRMIRLKENINKSGLPDDPSTVYQLTGLLPSKAIQEDLALQGELDAYAKVENGFFIVSSYEEREHLATLIQGIPEKNGRDELWKYLRNNVATIKFTDIYKDRIFASIVRRRKPILNERLYSTGGVLSAWDALIIAFEASSAKYFGKDELEEAEDDIKQLDTLGASLSEKKASEGMIVVDAEGRVRRTKQLTTSYPDYPYITYHELFDLPDEPNFKNNWTRYGYSFATMGILNLNPDSYGDIHAAVLEASSTRNAQRQLITNPGSPIPPSVFFWREDELDSLWTDLDDMNQEYFNKLSSLVIDIPYGIDGTVYENNERKGISEPGDETKKKSGIDPDGNDPDDATRLKGLGRIASGYMSSVKKMPASMVEKASADITTDQIESMMEAAGVSTWSELAKTVREDKIDKKWYLALKAGQGIAGTKGSKKDGILVPTPLYSFRNSPVGSYTRFTGVNGEAIATTIQLQHLNNAGDSTTWDSYINQLITQNAAGMDSPSQSGANVAETRTTMQKIMQRQKDIGNDLIRAFPAFRMYLVDFKGPRIVVQDTVHGYNALESVDITIDKNDAALAVIRLADPYGLLQGTYFGTEQVNGNYIKSEALLTSNENSDQGDILKRIKLKQGRAIQLRGGYSSDPDNLDITFTGRIAEIQFGDVTTIVAQGWKSELISKEIKFEETRRKGLGIQDLVISAIRHANPAGLGQVFSGVELSMINNFRTSLSTNESMFHTMGVQAGTPSQGTQGAGSEGVSFFRIGEGLGRGLDMRLKNIWIPDVDGTRWAQFGYGSIINGGWDAERWIVPLQSSWDVLQSATNYCWGYVCQVVPYDTEATLFFGKPDEMYFHTKGDHRKANFYKRLQAETLTEAGRHFRQIVKEWIKSGTEGWFSVDDSSAYLLQDLAWDQTHMNLSVLGFSAGSSVPFTDNGSKALKLTNDSFGAYTQLEDAAWTKGFDVRYVAGPDGVITIPNSHKSYIQAMSIIYNAKMNNEEAFSQGAFIEFFAGEYVTVKDKILKANWHMDLLEDYKYLVSELGGLTPANLLAAFYDIEPHQVRRRLLATPDSLVRALLSKHIVYEENDKEYDAAEFKNQIKSMVTSTEALEDQGDYLSEYTPDELREYLNQLDQLETRLSEGTYDGKYTPAFTTYSDRDDSYHYWSTSIVFNKALTLEEQNSLKIAFLPLENMAKRWTATDYFKMKYSISGNKSNKHLYISMIDSTSYYEGSFGRRGQIGDGFKIETLESYFQGLVQWPTAVNRGSGTNKGSTESVFNILMAATKSAKDYYSSELILLANGTKEQSMTSIESTSWSEISDMISFTSEKTMTETFKDETHTAQIILSSPERPSLLRDDLAFREKVIDDKHAIGFRSFIHFFAKYLKNVNNGKRQFHYPTTTDSIEHLKAVGQFDWIKALNMRVFRDYHYVQSHKDIIQNNIAATTREMHNTVVVKYPGSLESSNDGFFHSLAFNSFKSNYSDTQIESGTEWTTFPKDEENIGMQFNPSIAFENKKISVYTDLNCSRVDQAAKIATNWLAKRMRPMYRGNLLLTGRHIKPWDLLVLNDKFTDMYGPLEVERVVHHFNTKVGWVTNIIPHAVSTANPGNRIVQEAIYANKMDQIYDTIDLATWALTITMAIPTAGASFGAAMAGRAAIGTALKQGIKASAASAARTSFTTAFGVAKNSLMKQGTRALWLHLGSATGTLGLGEISKLMHIQSGMIDHQLPCFLSPLMYRGAPLVAGLEPSEYTTMSIGARMHWALRDAYDGINSVMRLAFEGFSPDQNSSASLIGNALSGGR